MLFCVFVSLCVCVARIPVRVVCLFRDTAATVVDVIVLSSCDFPALGGPTIATSSLRFREEGGGLLLEASRLRHVN